MIGAYFFGKECTKTAWHSAQFGKCSRLRNPSTVHDIDAIDMS